MSAGWESLRKRWQEGKEDVTLTEHQRICKFNRILNDLQWFCNLIENKSCTLNMHSAQYSRQALLEAGSHSANNLARIPAQKALEPLPLDA